MTDFERALAIVLKFEGGFVNDPLDKGGATNKGITQRVYDAFRTKKGLPLRSVELIEDAEVSEIYSTGYWVPIGGDSLSWPSNLVLFDCAVNAGPKQSIRLLQGVAGLPVDGQLGPNTLAAAKTASVEKLLLARCWFYCDLVRKDSTQQKFLPGWIYRTHQLFNLAK